MPQNWGEEDSIHGMATGIDPSRWSASFVRANGCSVRAKTSGRCACIWRSVSRPGVAGEISGGMKGEDTKRLKEPERENPRLKKPVAEQALGVPPGWSANIARCRNMSRNDRMRTNSSCAPDCAKSPSVTRGGGGARRTLSPSPKAW